MDLSSRPGVDCRRCPSCVELEKVELQVCFLGRNLETRSGIGELTWGTSFSRPSLVWTFLSIGNDGYKCYSAILVNLVRWIVSLLMMAVEVGLCSDETTSDTTSTGLGIQGWWLIAVDGHGQS